MVVAVRYCTLSALRSAILMKSWTTVELSTEVAPPVRVRELNAATVVLM